MAILHCKLLKKWWNGFKVKEKEEESGETINQWTGITNYYSGVLDVLNI
jgi:hypothetical protein